MSIASDMQMENVVGNRHKLHPCIKHERYRGSSQIKFSDGDPDSSRPWKTTNQVHTLRTRQHELSCKRESARYSGLCIPGQHIVACADVPLQLCLMRTAEMHVRPCLADTVKSTVQPANGLEC